MRPNRTLLLTCIALMVAGTSAPSSFAGPPAPDVLSDKAAALYDEGVVAFKKAKLDEARASFLAAWSLKKHWQIAASLADCEVRLGLNREAAGHFAYFLRNAPNDRHTPEIKKLYDAARTKIATLTVVVDVPRADVAVDGTVIGKAPLEDPVFVEPGHHTVEARFGAMLASAEVDAGPGAARTVELAVGTNKTSSSKVPVIIVGATVTGVALIAGAALALGAHGKAADADSKLATLEHGGDPCALHASTCADIDSDRAARDRLANASVGVFIGAAVVGLATAGYVLFAPTAQAKTSRTRLVPTIGAGFGGAVLTGGW